MNTPPPERPLSSRITGLSFDSIPAIQSEVYAGLLARSLGER